MMPSITLDIINEKALDPLRNLELLNLIRLRKDKPGEKTADMDWAKYKGAMSQQSLDEIDQQLNELRSEWE